VDDEDKETSEQIMIFDLSQRIPYELGQVIPHTICIIITTSLESSSESQTPIALSPSLRSPLNPPHIIVKFNYI
jgi:hypothetical protein